MPVRGSHSKVPSLQEKFIRCSNRLQVHDVIELLMKRLDIPSEAEVLFHVFPDISIWMIYYFMTQNQEFFRASYTCYIFLWLTWLMYLIYKFKHLLLFKMTNVSDTSFTISSKK